MKWHETKKKRLALTCLVSGLCVRVSNNQPLCRWGMQSSCHQLRVRENLVARNLSRSLKHTGGRRWLGKKKSAAICWFFVQVESERTRIETVISCNDAT